MPDLEQRVEARKRELIAEIVEHKKSSRLGAADAIAQLRQRLDELVRIESSGKPARSALEAWVSR